MVKTLSEILIAASEKRLRDAILNDQSSIEQFNLKTKSKKNFRKFISKK